MPATATGRGAQVVLDPTSDTAKAVRGAYAATFVANALKVANDISAGIATDGNRPDGTTTTTIATDLVASPLVGSAQITGSLAVSGGVGFFGSPPTMGKIVVTGSRGANAALASLLTALATYGLVLDSTTA